MNGNKWLDDHWPVVLEIIEALRAVLKHLVPRASVLETGEATPPIYLYLAHFSVFSVSVCSEL